MTKKILKNLTLAIIASPTLCVQLACQSKGKDENASLKALVKRMDAKIDFYGRVLDEQDHPVEGVDVEIGIHSFTPIPTFGFEGISTIKIKTNKEGNFIIINKIGKALDVEKITKKGYDTSASLLKVETAFYFDHELHTPFVPDPKNPLIYRMRKKGEGAFLFKGDGGGFRFNAGESGSQHGKDFIAEMYVKEKDFANPTFNGNPLVVDLKAKGTLNPKTGVWTMTLAVGDPTGGIIVSDRLLYEAPAEGYQPNYILSPESFQKEFKSCVNARGLDDEGYKVKGVYLYVRSRNPPLYTRIRINSFSFNKNEIILGGDGFVTNPYGDRNLEEATDLPNGVITQLENEVRRAFEHGQRPQKPDLQKLVR